jgi:hypothetical protein
MPALVPVAWKTEFWKAGWSVDQLGRQGEFLFPHWKLWRVPRDVRDYKLPSRISHLLTRTRFIDWWLSTCAREGDKLILLKFAQGAWDIPWEWLIDRLDYTSLQSTVCLARTFADTVPIFQTSSFSEPLRLLILQGDDGAKANLKLDLAAEANGILDAWSSLESSTQRCILRPEIAPAKEDTLPDLLRQQKPHLLWFSGHGRHDPAGLMFADGKYVSPDRIRELFAQSVAPLYIILNACDTARIGPRLPNQPEFILEFFRAGVLSVLAMQSRIGDYSASLLARELFGNLALGLSLEMALARARFVLRSTIQNHRNRTDWASPVVWTSTRLVKRWNWKLPDQHLAQMQLLGRELLRGRVLNPIQLQTTPSDSEQQTARGWISSPRTWVVVKNNDAEFVALWIRALVAVQSISDFPVIAVDLKKPDVETALQEWAEAVYPRLLPGDFPDDIVQLIFELTKNATTAWKKLCSLPGIFLAIMNPPDYAESAWFWTEVLSDRQDFRVAVLSDKTVPDEAPPRWAFEKLIPMAASKSIPEAIQKAPRLARALAVLSEPLGFSTLVLRSDPIEGPRSLDTWPEWRSVLVDIPGGPLMSSTARELLLPTMSSEERRTAHLDCALMLSHPDVPPTPQVREETLTHLLEAEDTGPAILEATGLCAVYRAMNRPFRVVEVVRRLRGLSSLLPSAGRLCAAWAFSQLGEVAQADYWLARVTPTTPLDQALTAGLRAETRKSRGNKEAALESIEDAIRICQKALQFDHKDGFALEWLLRNFRQDKARILQYLFYKTAEAAAEYENLIRDWNEQSQATIDAAVVRRNYAECLRTLAGSVDDPQFLKGRDLLHQAETTAAEFPDAPLLAEVLYEQAKFSEAEGGNPEPLLVACIRAARQSRHYQMMAIAQAQIFWNSKSFALDRWTEIETALEAFPQHGWAIRTLLNGRLRAARQLQQRGQPEPALHQLEANQACIKRNPAFTGRSDQFRIAATAAGIEIMGRELHRETTAWADFRNDYAWSEGYLVDQSVTGPDDFWNKVQ